MQTHAFDVVVVGAGIAGLAAALHAARTARTAVLGKVHPLQYQSAAVREGIAAALGSLEEDHPEWHAQDTLIAGDGLCDLVATMQLCREAGSVLRDLEFLGAPFSRLPDGRLDQHMAGGHTNRQSGKPVARCFHSSDHTGRQLLQTLYQHCLRSGVTFFDEYYLLDLLAGQGGIAGLVAMEISSGGYHAFQARAVVLATGGHNQMWKCNTGGRGCSGDGPAAVLRMGLPLQDLEFQQFHPACIPRLGIPLPDAAFALGGVLLNDLEHRFMSRYAQRLKELAPPDVLSRAVALEIGEKRGIDGQAWVNLDLRPETVNHHASRDGRTRPDGSAWTLTTEECLNTMPGFIGYARQAIGIDLPGQFIPVAPAADASPGGIPVNSRGEVRLGVENGVLPGLFAAGECAGSCAQGAAVLPGNGLLEALALGRACGTNAAEYAAGVTFQALPKAAVRAAGVRIERLRGRKAGEPVAELLAELQDCMHAHVGVFRTGGGLAAALDVVKGLRTRYQHLGLASGGRIFNQELVRALELGNLLDLAFLVITTALDRQESRGAHARLDFPAREDARWQAHSLAWLEDGRVRTSYRPVDRTGQPFGGRAY